MDIVQIKGEKREDLGKKAARSIRKNGQIPAVLYSKNGVAHFITNHSAVKSIVYTPEFKLAEIEIDGKSTKAILKEIAFHPVTEAIEHIDFLELIKGHEVKANIPVKFRGISPGVKAGGKLIRTLRTVNVKTKPEYLVDSLFVDIDELELGSAVRVRDIETPEGIELLVNGSIPVANVEVPRALKEDDEDVLVADAEGEGEEAAATEEAPAEEGGGE